MNPSTVRLSRKLLLLPVSEGLGAKASGISRYTGMTKDTPPPSSSAVALPARILLSAVGALRLDIYWWL